MQQRKINNPRITDNKIQSDVFDKQDLTEGLDGVVKDIIKKETNKKKKRFNFKENIQGILIGTGIATFFDFLGGGIDHATANIAFGVGVNLGGDNAFKTVNKTTVLSTLAGFTLAASPETVELFHGNMAQGLEGLGIKVASLGAGYLIGNLSVSNLAKEHNSRLEVSAIFKTKDEAQQVEGLLTDAVKLGDYILSSGSNIQTDEVTYKIDGEVFEGYQVSAKLVGKYHGLNKEFLPMFDTYLSKTVRAVYFKKSEVIKFKNN